MDFMYNFTVYDSPYFERYGVVADEDRGLGPYFHTFHHDVTIPLTGTELAKFPLPLQNFILVMRLYSRVFKIASNSAVKITAILVGRFFHSELMKMLNDAEYLESIVNELGKLLECRPNRLCLLAALTEGPPEDQNQLIQELLLDQISQYYPDLAHNIYNNIRFELNQTELVDMLQNGTNELTTTIHVQGAIIKHQFGKEPLTVDVLDRTSTRNRNKIVGACIFLPVHCMYPNSAVRIIDAITMAYNNSELVSMLNDTKELKAKITEIYMEISQELLTQSILSATKPEEQKFLFGTYLYPFVQARYPDLCGKITGMLLELDNDKLLQLVNNRKIRNSMIEKAVVTLAAHKERKAAESRKEAAKSSKDAAEKKKEAAKK